MNTAHFRKYVRVPIEQRFWAKVRKGDGCWLWTGSTNTRGYGQIGAGGSTRVPLMAHRVSYELHFGPLPVGAYVLHECDTPACVRPDHLRAGTQSENMNECKARGRLRPRGKPHPAASSSLESKEAPRV